MTSSDHIKTNKNIKEADLDNLPEVNNRDVPWIRHIATLSIIIEVYWRNIIAMRINIHNILPELVFSFGVYGLIEIGESVFIFHHD